MNIPEVLEGKAGQNSGAELLNDNENFEHQNQKAQHTPTHR
jgi:hypothetical protein